MSKDETKEGVAREVSHEEKHVVDKEVLDTAEPAHRRQSAAVNLVENPLKVSSE